MSQQQRQLEAGIAALEAQRLLLGDTVVDASIEGLRARLTALAETAALPPEPAQTLRQVSILFLDIAGSTMLAQHLDPEAVSAVIDDALARGTSVVAAHGGKVLQYAGDNILAAFGTDEAREDDAERAVRCGLALLELGKALAAQVQATHRHSGFNVRIGIHTGGVLLGGGVDADGTIRGIAVNIAARMEQTAPVGALRITQDTYAQVRGQFEVEAQEPLAVKGVDLPLRSYLVRQAKPRNFRIGTRGIEGVATRIIGRDTELAALQAAFERVFAERRLVAVTVVAEAGIGKSRLLHEFEAWSELRPERFFVFRGRATPRTGDQAFGLLRDILAWRFQINDDDSLEAARGKLERGIVPLFIDDDGPELAEGHAHLLGHLIGIEWRDSRHIRGILDDPKQIRNRALHAATQLFRRVSARGRAAEPTPVVLELEDLHWADDESLDFLNQLCEVSRDLPLLVLAITRPALFERRTDWRSTAGVHQRIDLLALGDDTSLQLAGELLKKLPEPPAALLALLTHSAEGNPFYMEELVKMLIDQGTLRTGEPWQIDTERLALTHVPPTLTGVLQARLDGLPPPHKRALQRASVIGAVFWDRALAAIDPPAAEQLPALVRRELTLPRAGAALDGLREYAFHHHLLHQVTYGTVLKRVKREGHARVAQWLAGVTAQGGLRGGDFLGLAAEHFEQAGDTANAAEFHARAAEQAVQRFAHERVLLHVSRALDLLGHPGDAGHAPAPRPRAELRWRLLFAREHALGLQARRDEQAADQAELAHLAESLDDDRRRAQAALLVAIRAMRMADWAAVASAARHGMACATQAGDAGQRLLALYLLAVALVYQGERDAGSTLAQQGLAEARSLDLPRLEARLLNVLSIAAGKRGDRAHALDLTQQALQACRRAGDRVNEAIGLSNLGVNWLELGALEPSRTALDAALKLLRANGDRAVEASALGALSALVLHQGDAMQARALAQKALEIATAAKAHQYVMFAGFRLGCAELALGLAPAARQAFCQVQALALEAGMPDRHDACAGLARVALAEGDVTSALAAVQPVLDHVAAGGTLDGTSDPRLIELSCHQALARAGDPRAVGWLVRAHAALMAQAEAISDSALRQGFLHNVPAHREIVAAWAAAAPAGIRS